MNISIDVILTKGLILYIFVVDELNISNEDKLKRYIDIEKRAEQGITFE